MAKIGYQRHYPDPDKYPVNYEVRKGTEYLTIFDGTTEFIVPIEQIVNAIYDLDKWIGKEIKQKWISG